MNVRGAPAIGVAAAYGFALAFQGKKFVSRASFLSYSGKIESLLTSTRPTAVNLFWACSRMKAKALELFTAGKLTPGALLEEACRIHKEDISANKKIGAFGAGLLPRKAVVITHCNAGALATGGYGTALGVIYAAHAQGKIRHVFVDETRPYLQGARLTAWELMKMKVPCTLITDSMAGHLMKTKKIDACIIGADRVVANGDTANKIGSYSLAINAKYHGVPFYVACPVSTFDLAKKDGSQIVIEQRSEDEVLFIGKTRIAPRGCRAWHPAFDVTPAGLIRSIITEKGVIKAPYSKNIPAVLN
jgi:methylthioribose-1-phosphate isomerase